MLLQTGPLVGMMLTSTLSDAFEPALYQNVRKCAQVHIAKCPDEWQGGTDKNSRNQVK